MPAPLFRRRAFTLVEMLLVIALITIVTLVTFPTLKNSIKGNRLKAATRAVVSAGRYARSMAVMRQQPVEVTFAVGGSRLTVTPGNIPAVRETGSEPASDLDAAESSDTPPPPTTGATGGETLTRTLEKVIVDSVELDDAGDATAIVYGTNGRCTPHTIRLQDEQGDTMVIRVDALASPTVESGR